MKQQVWSGIAVVRRSEPHGLSASGARPGSETGAARSASGLPPLTPGGNFRWRGATARRWGMCARHPAIASITPLYDPKNMRIKG